MNPYPLAGNYQAAMQNPDAAFTVTSLRRAQFAADSWGLPAVITGTSAAVFHATIGGGVYALRCFTRQDASSPERYAAFDSFVAGQGLGQHVGQVTWHDAASTGQGATWPVLQMEWIEGQQLNEYVGGTWRRHQHRRARQAGQPVAQARRRAAASQVRARRPPARQRHHRPAGVRLRLVDFDGVWILRCKGHSPTEIGHELSTPGSFWLSEVGSVDGYLSLASSSTWH
jgi:hypothetical protein